MNWIQETFGTPKPIIAMVHLPALPGSPLYDRDAGMDGIVEWARRDLEALQAGGVDAVMFCNENDRPYTLTASAETVAAMAYVVGRLKDRIQIPFGVDILWDPVAAVALAHAVGARFVREVFTGTYDSDMGLWIGRAAEALRLRAQLGANDEIRLLFNVSAEFASPLGTRPVGHVARSVMFSSLPDGICVSGPMTGEQVSVSELAAAKEAVGELPVFVNTGLRPENVPDLFRYADGAIVGTALKRDGKTFNPVDSARVSALMRVVRSVRQAAVSP
jgi:membrane complex biogenesis BtpA family protein